MKNIISLLIFLSFLTFWFGCGEKAKPQLTEQIKSGLRADAQEFMSSLKSVLVKEMQNNGVASAV